MRFAWLLPVEAKRLVLLLATPVDTFPLLRELVVPVLMRLVPDTRLLLNVVCEFCLYDVRLLNTAAFLSTVVLTRVPLRRLRSPSLL